MESIYERLFVIARRIWTDGIIENGCGILTPSWIVNDGAEHDEIIIDTLNATHFSRVWNEQGNSVKLTFYHAEAFGASMPDLYNPVKEYIVCFNTLKIN